MKRGILALACALFAFGGVMAEEPTADEKTLTQLREAGSDLSKPHEIDHWLYFPAQAPAQAVAKELAAKGFSSVSVAKSKNEWQVKAHNRMVPSSAAVASTTKILESLAAKHGGEYDGWETQVVE